ncbi:hypothetical protein CB1_000743102 [Camelus ferus]|nr:hypothetical protein CB1_000743102 [Camelus ferus]
MGLERNQEPGVRRKPVKVEESAVDRAKANAALWEARLEVTELSRIEYRDTSRRLAKSNENLKKQQYRMERDTMSVLSYLKKQDQEKDNLIEKLKQQLNETKEKAQEEKEKLLKEDLRNTEQKHQETLRRLEGKFFEEKEINDLLVKEKIMQLTQQRSQIQTLQKKVVNLENALSCMTKEFETEVLKLQQQSMIQNQAGQVEIFKLQQLLQMKNREMNRVKKLAKNILDERTEVERFFLDALHQVKQQILFSRKHYKQVAQAAFNFKMREACAGRTEYPKIRTFDGREHSTNSVNQDLMEANKWY